MTPLDAFQAALAGEHAAVYAYGVLGGRASRDPNPTARNHLSEWLDVHRARRDELIALITARHAVPVPSAASYLVPSDMTPAAVEQRCLPLYGQLVEATTADDRRWAIQALAAAAKQAVASGAAPENFPGR